MICCDNEHCAEEVAPTPLRVEEFGSFPVVGFFFEGDRAADFDWDRFGAIIDVLNAWENEHITLVDFRLWIEDEKMFGKFRSSTDVFFYRLFVHC